LQAIVVVRQAIDVFAALGDGALHGTQKDDVQDRVEDHEIDQLDPERPVGQEEHRLLSAA
jgi:hypothetical protein